MAVTVSAAHATSTKDLARREAINHREFADVVDVRGSGAGRTSRSTWTDPPVTRDRPADQSRCYTPSAMNNTRRMATASAPMALENGDLARFLGGIHDERPK